MKSEITLWQEELTEGKPLPCWVWNNDDYKTIRIIDNFKEEELYPYSTFTEEKWAYAKPIKPEECYQAKQEAKKGKWRLPTRGELLDAFDNKAEGFNPDSYYWSSSLYVSSTSKAWYVYFSNGYDFWSRKSYRLHVRCIRNTEDGMEWGDETDKEMTWYEAMEYAEEMNG